MTHSITIDSLDSSPLNSGLSQRPGIEARKLTAFQISRDLKLEALKRKENDKFVWVLVMK